MEMLDKNNLYEKKKEKECVSDVCSVVVFLFIQLLRSLDIFFCLPS